MLMREVDEAVRTEEVTGALRKYGIGVGILLVLALAAFGGYLYWDNATEAKNEGQSEALIQAMDELESGNLDAADADLAAMGDDLGPGAMASAGMLRAAIALEQGRLADGIAHYERVIANEDAPQPMRDASLIRLVSANYDNMDPQAVIDRLAGLAVEGNPWFGSAGELVAHAYLEQDKVDQAGPLLVKIAQSEEVPATLAARTRQLAGRYGYDAIEDVEETLDGMRSEVPADAGAAAQ